MSGAHPVRVPEVLGPVDTARQCFPDSATRLQEALGSPRRPGLSSQKQRGRGTLDPGSESQARGGPSPQSSHPAQGPWACLARACRPGGARFSPAWTGDPLSGPLES